MDALKIIFLGLALSSCAQFFSQKEVSDQKSQGKGISLARPDIAFEGTFTSEDGSEVSLSELKDRPVVLMFASMMCEYCMEEAVEVLETMPTRNTDVVHFVTILLDGTDMDAWRDLLPVTEKPAWLHGYDDQRHFTLYKTFFPEEDFPLTPSLVLYSPFQDNIITHIGRDAPDENQSIIEFIRSFIGRW